jgi:Zn-dependent peptidase ImmA (M78 family)
MYHRLSAQQILSNFAQEFPVDPMAIAKRMGINLVSEQSAVSGTAYCSPEGACWITYNMFDHPVRQRFTVAHEIGHHVLGHTQYGRRFRDNPENYSMSSLPEEREANSFAAELLMPLSQLEYMLYVQNVDDISQLAEIFNVSEIAMAIRLRNLGVYRG